MEYAVVTKTLDSDLAMTHATHVDLDALMGRGGIVPFHEAPYGSIQVMSLLSLCEPVFVLGEIMVLSGGRELSGRGRKPIKWGVECEVFDTIEEAEARAIAVNQE